MTRVACIPAAKAAIAAATALFAAAFLRAAPPASEISVRLSMDNVDYVSGERIRCVVDIRNSSADSIDAGSLGSEDRFVIELCRAADGHRYDKASKHPFVAPFTLHSGEGQKLEAYLGDHFPFKEETRYLARAVLVHRGMRYESSMKAFAVVPGMVCGSALQLFKNRPSLKRRLELVHWSREGVEHLFLKSFDAEPSVRRWQTTDLGPVMRMTPPKISVSPGGEITTLHRATRDAFVRTVFWSLPDVFEFHEQEQMTDPDVAGTARVKELYQDAGGVTPVKKAWWKFW